MFSLCYHSLNQEQDIIFSYQKMKNIFLYITLLFSTLILTDRAEAQISELSVNLSKDSILIGEPVDLELSVIKDKNVFVSFPAFSDTIIRGIEILYLSDLDTIPMGDKDILKQKITISAYDSGYYNLPSFIFPLELNGVKDTIRSLPLALRIDLPEIDPEADFKDIKSIINTPLNFKEALPFILAGLLILMLAFVAYRILLKYRKKRSDSGETLAEVPAYILALDQLQQLRIQKAWETTNIKEYYTKLSAIVRTYLEKQFSIKALELTTLEILMDFELLFGRDPEITNKLEELLGLSDLVKFAREAPSSLKNLENLDIAISFVEETKMSIQSVEEADIPDK